MNCIIVDDDKLSRVVLEEFIAKTDDLKLIASFQDAISAANSINRDNSRIDLIFLDIEMPEMNGIEATVRIKAYESLKDVPVIMVTADLSSGSLEAAFNAGAVDYITKPIRKVELLARVQSTLKLKQETDARKARESELVELTTLLTETNDKLKTANEQLGKMTMADGLTNLFNRRYFDETLEKEWKRMMRSSQPLSLLMIDIDYFKPYNDTYGHPQGDECLKQVAGVLRSVLKRPGDFVARYGGEEFAVVLPETNVEGATTKAQAMLDAITVLKLPHTASKVADHVTVSIGIATQISIAGFAVSELIDKADQALYRSKKEGRNRLTVYDRLA